jgi:hypothetical protein
VVQLAEAPLPDNTQLGPNEPELSVTKYTEFCGVVGVPAGSVSVTVTLHVELGCGMSSKIGLSQLMVVVVDRPFTWIRKY